MKEVFILAFKLTIGMAWFFLGCLCGLSGFLLMADDKTPAIILMCIAPFWVAVSLKYKDQIMKDIFIA